MKCYGGDKMSDKRWACLVLICGIYLSLPDVSVAADLIVASSAKPLDLPVVPLAPLKRQAGPENKETASPAVNTAPPQSAAAPAATTVVQPIALPAPLESTKGYTIPNGSKPNEVSKLPAMPVAAPPPNPGYELSPGPLKTAFTTIASRHNFRLHWEESEEWKPNSSFEYSFPMDGKNLFEDLTKFKDAIAAGGRVVSIDIWEGNSVVSVRGVN